MKCSHTHTHTHIYISGKRNKKMRGEEPKQSLPLLMMTTAAEMNSSDKWEIS